jgi:hypothetical protein
MITHAELVLPSLIIVQGAKDLPYQWKQKSGN